MNQIIFSPHLDDAVLYYRSQVSMLFGTPEAVPNIFREYSQSISQDKNAFGEKLWHPNHH